MPKGSTSRPSNRSTKTAVKKYGKKSVGGLGAIGKEQARRKTRKAGATTKNANLRANLAQRERTGSTLGKSIATAERRRGAKAALLKEVNRKMKK